MFLRIFIVFFITLSHSQNDCQNEVLKIFDNIIFNIGNNFPSPPNLEFSDTENNPAWISPSKKIIYIENKLINLICGDENFSNKVAYIISHEIAHHYLNHGWMRDLDFSYSSTTGDYLYDQSYSLDQRKNDEIQADIFGGFYSKISGYNSLSYGSEVLSEVYSHYQLNENIKGYPSLEERKDIVLANIDKTERLADYFFLGNLSLVTENYFYAKKCFDVILKNNFNSREIFNNLGVTYLTEAINNSDEEISKYNYPIFLENNTRAKNELTRNSTINTNIDLLMKAKSYFQLSLEKDPNYKYPLVNLLITELIIAKLNGNLNKGFLKRIDTYSKSVDITKLNDLKVLNLLLLNKTVSTKLINQSSQISRINIKIETKKNNFKLIFPKYNEVNRSDFIFLQRPYIKLKKVDIIIKKFDKHTLTKLGKDINIIEIFDKDYLHKIVEFTNDKTDIYNKIIELNNFTYKINTNNSIILKFDNYNKISSAILYNF